MLGLPKQAMELRSEQIPQLDEFQDRATWAQSPSSCATCATLSKLRGFTGLPSTIPHMAIPSIRSRDTRQVAQALARREQAVVAAVVTAD